MSYKDWHKSLSDEESIRFAGTLASLFASRVGDSGEVFLDLLNRSDWNALLAFEPPMDMGDVVYYQLAQAQACFSKLACLPTGIDTEAVALKKFLDGEWRCGIYNRIFESRASGRFRFDPDVEAVLHGSQRKIAEILGDCPEISRVPLRLSVGGATTKTKKKDADLRQLIAECNQLSEELFSDTTKLAELLGSLPHLFPIWDSDEETVFDLTVHTGRLDFVRKNAKTKRAITVEPPLNKVVQNGYGDVMRLRLKRYGCDLQDSTRQQVLARLGSLYDRIATVDLTNASGLICNGLVQDQLPEPWLDAIYWCRTGTIRMPDGSERILQSFAGMGNGCTFPLESLLFQAICDSVCDYMSIPHPISSVYGDDICITREAIPLLYKVFAAIGLQVNEDKSFVDGPFREACGEDWYCGYNVRPVFIRDNVSAEVLYTLHNQFAARGEEEVCDIILRQLHAMGDSMTRGPEGYGDGHLHVQEWRSHAERVNKDGFAGWNFTTYRHKPRFNYTVTALDSVVPLAMIDSGYRSTLSMTVDAELALRLGRTRSLLLSPQFMRKRDYTRCERLRRQLRELARPLLREDALQFREPLAALPVQTQRMRDRRGWKVKFQGIPRPPHDTPVFGTPLPGSQSVEAITLYILG